VHQRKRPAGDGGNQQRIRRQQNQALMRRGIKACAKAKTNEGSKHDHVRQRYGVKGSSCNPQPPVDINPTSRD
jgi:hypothetical protein